ncbi:hypothetical protein CcaverHIS002_0202640 [Cutaneotrichosporon cavernicola]|uniref:Rab-GAP TBC domain-containing protein n=1 Tax=Cutaneotrichosporon cavernicola TaxID=279322 RepID=A0AA48I3X7_9TREE|nr:uncharacterized protein CcaverHIS019_0202640 [Cutaneotrichosporon cavernicola]BEI81104.1 hypothetical protein CcaverHIS002_0202640 [Cutaneotrichosporon cavernicola]BEI88902.1 hypothetical protein CcaverHIS019_0202640 [Cutaneotrichosporon cavernicola]BEI96679.1 hypothetical protein CcaverHIS631_0202680 [Cutaneotrichosporon cavernicola]BEJ04451.1 hypothetical protein CcaverHIS641_0202680 [Cutaneotrichosporon cavernicola]
MSDGDEPSTLMETEAMEIGQGGDLGARRSLDEHQASRQSPPPPPLEIPQSPDHSPSFPQLITTDGLDTEAEVDEEVEVSTALQEVTLDSPTIEPNHADDVASPPQSDHPIFPPASSSLPPAAPAHSSSDPSPSLCSPVAADDDSAFPDDIATDDTPPTPPPHSPSDPSPLPRSPVTDIGEQDSPPPTPPKDRPAALGFLAPHMASSPRMTPSPVESLSSRRQQIVTPIKITEPSPEASPARSPIASPTQSQRALSPKPVHASPRTPDFLASPRFRSMDLHAEEDEDEDEDEDGDPSGQYENVSLDAATPASPSVQTATLKDVVDGKPSIPTAVTISVNGSHGGSRLGSIAGSHRGSMDVPSPVSGSSTPRIHAPPAHPHPFPIPTSPRSGPVPQVTDLPGKKGNTPPAALGVKGVSTMDKFLSRTRMQHLPPKPKAEDETHLHEWEQMMAKAREHDAERRKQEQTRRAERERHLLAVTPRWESLLARDFSVDKIRESQSHRQLWFEGIPSHLRGKAWALAIGNSLAMHRDAYKGYLRRAQRAIESGRFPADILEQLEVDLDDTLPHLHVFQRGSPVRDELKDLVCAWVVYRSDSGRGYAPYITLLAAMFALVSPPAQAFLSLCNFLSRPCLHAFYTDTRDEIDAFYRVFENLQADKFPRIYANCKNLGLKLPESYFRSVLVEQVPFEAACRLWDQIVLEGDGYIFRSALAIFGFLEPRLYYPDKDEIASVLEGRNAATAAIAERERERARLRGEQYEESLDGKLSVFGLHEDALFDWLAQDGWKESAFERLVVRELPD